MSKANLKAKKLLVLAVDIEPLLRIEGCKMAHEIWDKLNLIYDVQSAENIDLLWHKFHEIRWQTTSTIESHLKEFDVIRTKMDQLKKPIDEDDLGARLLQTLPKEFDNIYVTWHNLPSSEKMWDKLNAMAKAIYPGIAPAVARVDQAAKTLCSPSFC